MCSVCVYVAHFITSWLPSLSYSSCAKHYRSLILFLSFELLNRALPGSAGNLFLLPHTSFMPVFAPLSRLVYSAFSLCCCISSIYWEAVPLSTSSKDFTRTRHHFSLSCTLSGGEEGAFLNWKRLHDTVGRFQNERWQKALSHTLAFIQINLSQDLILIYWHAFF